MNIVKIQSDSLTLSSGLSQESFAKTHLTELLPGKSTLIYIEENAVSKSDYSFTGTKTDADGITLFEGNPVHGKTLSDILSVERSERSRADDFALSSFSRAVDFLLAQDEIPEAVGAGGIIVNANENEQKADVLFLGSELFEICAQNHKESYADLQGKYLYKGLSARDSLLFLRAAVCYKAISGKFPFENDDTSRRQEDIFDENFVPISLSAPRLVSFSDEWETLAESIDSALTLSVKKEVVAGKRTISDKSAQKKERKKIARAEEFDSDDFKRILEKLKEKSADSAQEAEFFLEKKRAKFLKKTKFRVTLTRFFRRNKNRILASLAAIFVVGWFVSGIVRENGKLVTTKGLSSLEATHALYTAIHLADVPNVQEIVSGKETKDLIMKVSGYFVSEKQRLETSPDNGTIPPEKWFFYKKESKNWMFGITNLKIDGEALRIEQQFPARKENPLPISQENGKVLQKGDETAHTAEYFLLHQAESRIFVEKMRDTVTLRWNGKQWHVVKIEGTSKPSSVKSKDFIEKYFSLLEKASEGEKSGVKEAAEILREEYEWIPSAEDFTDAAIFLRGEYGSVEAERYLGENFIRN